MGITSHNDSSLAAISLSNYDVMRDLVCFSLVDELFFFITGHLFMYSFLNALAEQQASTLTFFFFFRYWVIFAGVLRITDMFHDVVLAKIQLPDKLGSHRGVHDQLIFF